MKDKNWTAQHEKLYSMLLKYYQKFDDKIDENSFINDNKGKSYKFIEDNSYLIKDFEEFKSNEDF